MADVIIEDVSMQLSQIGVLEEKYSSSFRINEKMSLIIIENTDLSSFDIGPNGLWDFYESESLDEYFRFRFTINSIGMGNDDIGEWTNLIRERDKQWIAFNDIERIQEGRNGNMLEIYSME